MWGFDKWIGPRGKKRRERRFCFETKEEAEAVLAQLRLNARSDEFGLPRPKSLILLSTLIQARENEKPSDKHRKQMLYVLKRLSSEFPGIALQAITTANLKEFVQAMRAPGEVQETTLQHYLRLIASALHSAHEYFPSLETWKAPKIPYLRGVDKRRERIYSPDEVRRILSVLRSPPSQTHKRGPKRDPALLALLADLFELALLTVRRVGELLTVRKADVKLDLNLVRIVASKGDEAFFNPLGERAREIVIARIEKSSDSQFLFANNEGPTKTWINTLHRNFMWACEQAGVPYGNKTPDGVVFHDSRHTAVTGLLLSGIDLATVQSLSRHSDSTIMLRYGHATATSQREAIAALEDFTVQVVSKKAHPTHPTHGAHDTDSDDNRAVNQ